MTTIALDLDDTLIDTFTVLHDWIEAEFGYRVADDPLARYELDANPERTREIVEAFYRSGADLAVDAHPGALAGCRQLVESGFELVIVTSRWTSLSSRTITVVDRVFPDIFKDIHHVGHHPDKTSALRDSGAAVFVDDLHEHVRKAGEIGVESILFGDLPWNRDKQWPRRAEDWPNLMRLLERRRE